jgi:hypothetical protein
MVGRKKRAMNYSNSKIVESSGEIVVTLDCEPVVMPAGRASLNSIRSYLESLALARQRVLGEIVVDGRVVDLSLPLDHWSFRRVDAVTVSLSEQPLLLLTTAEQQAGRARAAVEAALTLVLINNPRTARELWWQVAAQLKEPVLTLSLMPEHLCELWCGTTFQKLRRWQLEQISNIVRRVDAACDSQDNLRLSDELENLVLPWLDRLAEHIRLWLDATQAGARLGMIRGTA